ARNAEKAMTALARFRQAQLEEGKVKVRFLLDKLPDQMTQENSLSDLSVSLTCLSACLFVCLSDLSLRPVSLQERRPFLASECSELPKAEKWRRQIISEISKKVAQIQNAGLGEFRIRDLNDEINKLLREKGHWEVRIKELGGPDYARVGPKMLDHEGKEVPGNRGYKYFGAARDLPGVRELFEKEPAPALRKTRAELMKDVDAEYYGYRDEDDGVLLPLEAQYEKQAVLEAVQRWRAEKESRLSGDKQQQEEEEEESIYTVHNEEVSPHTCQPDDEESLEEQEGEEGGVTFIAHVPVPSQREVILTPAPLTVRHMMHPLTCLTSGLSHLWPVCLSGGGGSGQEEEDGVVAALRQRGSAGSESDGQNSAGPVTCLSVWNLSVCGSLRHEVWVQPDPAVPVEAVLLSVGHANLSCASRMNRGLPACRAFHLGVPPFIPNEALERKLQRFGKLASGFRTVGPGCKSDKLKHVQSLRRQVFMFLTCPSQTLEVSFRVKHGEEQYMVYASTGSMKCFECGDVGHKRTACPHRLAEGRPLRREAPPHRLRPRQGRDTAGRLIVRPGSSQLIQTDRLSVMTDSAENEVLSSVSLRSRLKEVGCVKLGHLMKTSITHLDELLNIRLLLRLVKEVCASLPEVLRAFAEDCTLSDQWDDECRQAGRQVDRHEGANNKTTRVQINIDELTKAGVLFDVDVDGVLLRGGSVIPAARRAFRKLLDKNNNFLLPVVFVTNAGSCQRQHKAKQLSHLLEVQIAPEQVVLSHSPLRLLKSFHDKCVLVSGQGPVTDIANTLDRITSLGFQKVVSIEQLREYHPLLDMVDHKRRPKLPVSILPVTAIILFGEPIRWETNLQLLMDVLLTNGSPGSMYDPQLSAHLPVLACNMDLMWMAEAPSPRFGHGMFLLCLESVYRKLTGRELQYQALLGKPSLLTYQYAEHVLRLQNHNHKLTTIYAVGDNLMTDIYGANLYNRYLTQQHATMTTSTKLVAQGTGSQVTMAVGQEELVSAAAQCRSILVCTGVYNPRSLLPSNQSRTTTETVFHGHRDLVLEPGLVEPSHLVEDVEAAVDLLLQQENLDPCRPDLCPLTPDL
ncbi:hypothetical protein L3Q82_024491, partial [Scortum barcoo]